MSEINQKAQKLASAIYLISGFFGDSEPLKWRFRTLATDLASESIKDKLSLVKEIASLFLLAQNAGLVSEINYEILSRELHKFAQDLENPLNKMFLSDSRLAEKALLQPESKEIIKDKTLELSTARTEDRSILKEFGAVSVKKNSRQSIIIALLKRKKEIMIKDVSPLIDGCSEKTIQRELLTMVASGILRKIGEKRWSRYTLAHA